MSSGVDRGHLLTEQANPASADLDLLSTSELVRLFCEEDRRPQQAVAGAAAESSVPPLTPLLRVCWPAGDCFI